MMKSNKIQEVDYEKNIVAHDTFTNNNDVGVYHSPTLVYCYIKKDMKEILIKLSKMQNDEFDKNLKNINYKPRLRISIVTARNAPAHKRVIKTIRNWGIDSINEAFFLGGIEKRKVLEIINPHIFFDDQYLHIDPTKDIMPSVHIPFGRINRIDKQGEG